MPDERSALPTPLELKQRLDSERRGDPFLVYRDGKGDQRIFLLEDGRERLTVGRDEATDLKLDWDGQVSRLHAELEHVAGAWLVVDDGLSRNGTFVGTERVMARRRLRDGDAVRCGGTVLVFRDPGAAPAPASTRSAEAAGADCVSPAQRRVLVALCRPYKQGDQYAMPPGNKQIADELVLSVDAIKTHMRALFQTFGLEDVPQAEKRVRLVERALAGGVISPREL